MPSFYIIKFAKICFTCDGLPLKEIVYTIDVTCFKSINKETESNLVLNNIPNHELNRTTLFNLLFNLSIIVSESSLGLTDFFLDPGSEVNTVYEGLGVIIVFLK